MSRIEATIPELRLEQIKTIEEELGISKSQLVDEALALYLRAIFEVKRGRRVGILDEKKNWEEFTTPTFGLLEWANHREKLVLSDAGFDRAQKMIEHPPEPPSSLREAMRKRRR